MIRYSRIHPRNHDELYKKYFYPYYVQLERNNKKITLLSGSFYTNDQQEAVNAFYSGLTGLQQYIIVQLFDYFAQYIGWDDGSSKIDLTTITFKI